MIGATVTVPAVTPLIATEPVIETVMVIEAARELTAPSCRVILAGVGAPLAGIPRVPTLKVQGSMVTCLFWPSGLLAGNVDPVTLKMHEPKSVVPVAVLPPEPTENAGLVAVEVKATEVSAVVPNCETPSGNENGTCTTADVVVGLAARTVSDDATIAGSSLLLPQADRREVPAKNTKAKSFFIATSFHCSLKAVNFNQVGRSKAAPHAAIERKSLGAAHGPSR